MEHHVIYVPGLGDRRSYGQNIAIKYWRVFGLRAQYLALGWRRQEGFPAKLKRLTDTIDTLTAQGHKVSLVGTSAGASAVLAAYALRPNLNRVVTIAGKINRPETIGTKIRREDPDFYEAAQLIRENVKVLSQRGDLENILCVYADGDTLVPPKDAILSGSSKHAVPGWSHLTGIIFGLTLGAPKLAHFLKSRRSK